MGVSCSRQMFGAATSAARRLLLARRHPAASRALAQSSAAVDRPMLHCSVSGCNEAFASLAHLQRHQRFHDPTRKFECSICGHRFIDQATLSTHIRYTHSDDRPYECSQPGCSYSCKSQSDLTKHVQSCIGKKEFACAYEGCKALFNTQFPLRQHYSRVHTKRSEKTHRCLYCDYSTHHVNDLKKHNLMHVYAPVDKEGNPDQSFMLSTAQQGYPIQCSFPNPSYTEISTAINSARNSYPDPNADPNAAKSWARIKVHHCLQCSKSFTRPDALREHVLGQHPTEIHHCYHCNQGLFSYDRIRRHVGQKVRTHKYAKECSTPAVLKFWRLYFQTLEPNINMVKSFVPPLTDSYVPDTSSDSSPEKKRAKGAWMRRRVRAKKNAGDSWNEDAWKLEDYESQKERNALKLP